MYNAVARIFPPLVSCYLIIYDKSGSPARIVVTASSSWEFKIADSMLAGLEDVELENCNDVRMDSSSLVCPRGAGMEAFSGAGNNAAVSSCANGMGCKVCPVELPPKNSKPPQGSSSSVRAFEACTGSFAFGMDASASGFRVRGYAASI